MSLEALIGKVRAYNPGAPIEAIRQAYEFSAEVHRSQRRLSGEPYLTHPLAVAGIIADLRLDVPSVASGLLHDTVEDTLVTLEQVQHLFGPEIAQLVDGVTKIGRINFASREEKQAENFRKMIVAMARDIRVILIKLADRTHNMRTLSHLAPDKQCEVARETLDIYAPLAHRLGIYWMKNELEDACLRFLHPEVYYQLKRQVAKKRAERERYTKEVIGDLTKKLEAAGIEAEVAGRPKHFFSIYDKMQSQNLLFDQIYDLVAFRVLVDSTRECYEALGVVHAHWKPVPGRFKDYIALPKANGYQSLHTTVIGPYGERMEIQIRTRAMHWVAENGIAAHWRYKGGAGVSLDDVQRFTWLRQLLEWQQNVEDPREFLHSVKEDLFAEEVFVFTPKGDLLNFPRGATVIDFAYRIHSEVGHRCTGARANGRLVPLRYELQNGDTIEIITTQHQTPGKDWLKFARTPRAKDRIRSWIKAQQRTRSVALGRELLERDLSRHGLDFTRLRREGRLGEVALALALRDEEALLAALGYGRLTSRQVLAQLLPAEALGARRAEPRRGAMQRLASLVKRQSQAGVKVSGIDDVLVHYARCCTPLPGEGIIGFVTRGRGVTVHAADCPRVLESDPHRRLEVTWDGRASGHRTAKVEVVGVDEPGLLAAMSKAISSAGVNITRASVRSGDDKRALNTFEIVVTHVDDLNRVLRNLERVRGVLRAHRMRR